MRETLMWLARGVAMAAVVASVAFPTAGYANDNDDDDEQEQSEQDRSEQADRELSGQVMGINTLKDPPEMYIANMDGIVVVRMMTKDLITRHGVRLGDHVTVIGEKVDELSFDSQDMSIDAHLGDNDNDDE